MRNNGKPVTRFDGPENKPFDISFLFCNKEILAERGRQFIGRGRNPAINNPFIHPSLLKFTNGFDIRGDTFPNYHAVIPHTVTKRRLARPCPTSYRRPARRPCNLKSSVWWSGWASRRQTR